MLQNAFHRSVSIGHERAVELFSCPRDALSDQAAQAYIDRAARSETDRINRFRQASDRKATIIGRYLLGMALTACGSDLSLTDIAYNEDQKPYFPSGQIDFSISHTQGLVLCVAIASFAGAIGIDLEEIGNASLEEMRHVLTLSEIDYAMNSPRLDKALTFLWTAKEAVLKAEGTGFIVDCLPEIRCTPSHAWEGACHYQGNTYNIMNIDVHSDIVCSLAYSDFRR